MFPLDIPLGGTIGFCNKSSDAIDIAAHSLAGPPPTRRAPPLRDLRNQFELDIDGACQDVREAALARSAPP